MRILSLGAGVQSSTLALMIEHGEVESVDCAIFANTQWEPYWVYDYLNWLESKVSYPIHRVTAGNLRESVLNDEFCHVPYFVKNEKGKLGIGRRQCTNHYKVQPILKKKRELLGYSKGQKVTGGVRCETLIGISLDEVVRMKDSKEKWNRNLYPLIELEMSRDDCLAWLINHNYPIPRKSACIGCPYRTTKEWREIKDDAALWQDALEVDDHLSKSNQFMCSKGVRLPDLDVLTAEEHGQLNLFDQECEGMCGV